MCLGHLRFLRVRACSSVRACVRACVFWRAIVSSLMSELLNHCTDPSERCWFSLACQISRLPFCGKNYPRVFSAIWKSGTD